MTDLLNTGKSALFAFQRALATTSHNIANVDTEGYSRQRVDFEALTGNRQAEHYTGTGVKIINIDRLNDQFATARVFSATSAHAQQQTHHQMASRLDNLMASDGISIAPTLSELFDSLQDANIDPSSTASREVVIQNAKQLANRFQSLQNQLDDAQSEINDRTREAVKTVDEFAQRIATINKSIVGIQGSLGTQQANDLMDQRDQAVLKISEFVDVNTVEQSNGALNVYIGKGIGLVIDGGAQELTTVRDSLYQNRTQIQIGQGASAQVIDSNLQGGLIGGLDAFASETLHPAMQELGRLALTIADQINEQHARGIDIDGIPGGAMFGTADPQIYSNTENTGNATIVGSVSDTSSLVASDYLLRYDGANFTATRISDGVQTTGPAPMTVDGVDFRIDSGTPVSGDTFVVSAVGRAAASMEAMLDNPEKLALAGQLSTNSSLLNLGDSRISGANVIDPEAISLTVPIDIQFTSSTQYDIVDASSGTVMTSGNTYTQGQEIEFNGWQVSISGDAKAGDTHNISPGVNANGDNNNGLMLAQLQNSTTIGGTQTFNDAYGTLVSRVGSQTNTAASLATSLDSLKNNAIDRQQSMQGVNLDEEAIDLTRYQQAYQASAQIISTADTMFQTILGAIR